MRSKRMLYGGFILVLITCWPLIYTGFWDDGIVVPDATEIRRYSLASSDFCTQVIIDSTIYTQSWDTLIQPRFWRYAMDFGPDTVIVNIAKTREIVEVLPLATVRSWGEKKKKAYEDSLRTAYGAGKKGEIFFTTGRKHFYHIDKVLPEIDRAIEIFQKEGTDPWYAQSILLIESPGRLQFSTEGAYGAFQLMEGVAREQGLIVNDSIDERAQFDKAAQGAARLIHRVCLPKARGLCEKYKLDYAEHELWFRLLTMHIYHAGIGNVRRVIRKIRPKKGDQTLITKIWQTKSRRFGNASQNYSQITLATLLELDELIQKEGIFCPLAQEANGELVPRELR
ncbi:MAG: hypothetical protein AAF135_07650 [Bacteroidota bacterium]